MRRSVLLLVTAMLVSRADGALASANSLSKGFSWWRLPFQRRPAEAQPAVGTQPPLTITAMASTVSAPSSRLVRDHMASNVITIPPSMSLHDASCLLVQNGITGAPVVEQKGGRTEVIGMLSQTDLLYKTAGHMNIPLKLSGPASVRYASNTRSLQKALAGDCRGAMSSKVVNINEGATIKEAAATLLKHKVSRLPVVDDSKSLVGLISASDVMQMVVSDPDACAVA